MRIDFFSNFYKKENSTKIPSVGSGSAVLRYQVEGHIKEPCSILQPTISLQGPITDSFPGIITYAYIPAFYRYYFVKDFSFVNGLWTAQLSVDVLASWKTNIGTKEMYILRTDQGGNPDNWNGEITDTTYPATTDCDLDVYYMPNVFTNDLTVGCYVVGVIAGESAQSVGAITYYAMDSSAMGNLKSQLLSNENLVTMGITDAQGEPLISDISPELLKTLYNPFQYIASCLWFPFPLSAITAISTPVTEIELGWWGYICEAQRLYAHTLEFGESGPVRVHPQAASRGSYLNYAPYTHRYLMGRFGMVALDPLWYTETDDIDITYKIDLITGQCLTIIGTSYYVETVKHLHACTERHFQLAVPIQLAQIGVDYLGTAVSAVNTVAGTIGNALTGNVGGAITGALSGIYNTLQSAMPQMETSGQNGSFLTAGHDTCVVNQFFKIVDEDLEHRGRPLCEMRRINTLQGYILCADGEIDLDVYSDEREMIRNHLTSGFFWE